MTIRIELIPTVTHCIETVAKREYWKTVDEYLGKGAKDEALEENIELLKSFLESADFGRLRGESDKHLLDGKKVTFTLSIENGKLKYEMTVDKA